MIEKVNPSHPDKVADRIAGAIVDLAYAAEENPKIAVEVLLDTAFAMRSLRRLLPSKKRKLLKPSCESPVRF